MFFVTKTKIWTRLFLIFVLDDSEDTLYIFYIFCTYTVDYKHMVGPNSLIINHYYYYWHHTIERERGMLA